MTTAVKTAPGSTHHDADLSERADACVTHCAIGMIALARLHEVESDQVLVKLACRPLAQSVFCILPRHLTLRQIWQGLGRTRERIR